VIKLQRRDKSIENYAIRAKRLNSDMIIAIYNYARARIKLKVFATNKLIDHLRLLGGLHS
jgi:hypothetical protein